MPNQMLGANQANLFMAGISGQHAFPSHVQNQGLLHNSWRRDPDIFLMRGMMCKRIHAYFQRQAKYHEWGARVHSIVKKLESRLFADAKTKVEYIDEKTLPLRLLAVLKSSSKPNNPIFPSPPIHSVPPTLDQFPFSKNRPLMQNIEGTIGLGVPVNSTRMALSMPPLQNENGSVAGLSAALSSHYLNHMVDGIGMTVSMRPQIQNRFVDGQAAASSAHYLNCTHHTELHRFWACSEDSALIQVGYKPPAAAPIMEPLMKFSEENQSPTWAITERDDQKHAWKMGHREPVVTEPLMKCAEIESPTCASMEEDGLNDACKMGQEDPSAEHFMNFQKNDYETGHEEPAAAEHLLKCVEETESPSSPRNIKTADQNDCCKVGHEKFVDNFQSNDYGMGHEEPASTEHLLKCVEETESPSSLRNMKGNDQNDCCKVGHEKSVDNCIYCEKTEFVQNFLEAPDEDIAVSGKIKEQTLSRNPKINVVSLLESFTPRQIKEHMQGLRQRINEGNSEGMEMQNVGDSVNETSCQLCAVEKHFLEPPPIYCSVCCQFIRSNQTYYTATSGEKQYYFCSKCHSMQSKKFNVDGVFIPKAHLRKQKNAEQLEESWVRCDRCAAWHHQICSLFNHWRNQGGQAQYTCPHCLIQEMESGKRKPLPKNACPGAEDLPRTTLSDHIEQRLCRKLKEERQQRARLLGVNFDEVPGAEELVVRVVSSINKKFNVLPQLSETFSKQGYPSELPYRSKVILLFQKIEGVDVCLFSMHIQEFGSECPLPNKRRVFISYLDSVKYFRPEIKAATGEALRTFVYHQILIGYLDYCKRRDFTSCHIWSSPPSKGDDYMLYCHPNSQKVPKSDMLRKWYQSMLQKAVEETIVVECTNLYDHLFPSADECETKVTVTCLPYFDGDYLPNAIEDVINILRREEEGKLQGKGRKRKRALKNAGYAKLSGGISRDALLMEKLGETIYPVKEDFIVAVLQYSCSCCHKYIEFGNRWVSNLHRNFQLCHMCYKEAKFHDRGKHPSKLMENHSFSKVVEKPLEDRDEILESCIFQTRHTFLKFCQENSLQFDTLRRAKYSTTMLLDHLHNPSMQVFSRE